MSEPFNPPPAIFWCTTCEEVHAGEAKDCVPPLGSESNPLFCTECGMEVRAEDVEQAVFLIGVFNGRCVRCLNGTEIVVKPSPLRLRRQR